MRILIIGAAGMLGGLLASALGRAGALGGKPVGHLLLADRVRPAIPQEAAFAVEAREVDLTGPDACHVLAEWRPDVVFHLAAVVSGEAEARFEKGYEVNVQATWSLLEQLRAAGTAPRLVFASSLAVYGAPCPDPVPDDFHIAPQSSYGAQKAIGELLVSDYARKGYVDGLSVRLPTIVVRPGAPNAAASGFLSGIIREPLAGRDAVLPVPLETAVWIASPRVAIETLLHAAALPSEALGDERRISGRGISVTVGAMVDALRDVAGSEVATRVRPGDDPAVARIVRSWPRSFEAAQATRLGFPVDGGIHAIIEAHLRDRAGGRTVA